MVDLQQLENNKFQEGTGYPKSTVRVTNVDSSGKNISSFVDTNNGTDTPLLSGQTFTGQATDITNYSAIGLMVYSDVNSANDGLCVEFSFDGSDWHEGEMYTIPAGVTKFFTPPKQGKYYRVRYTNNGDDQTEFHIHSLVSVYPTKWSSHNLKDNLNDDDDAELNISVLKLRTAQDNYVSGSATNSGNFKTSLEEIDPSITQTMDSFSDNMDGKEGLVVASAMYGRVGDTLLVPIKVDGSTQDLQVLSHEHAEVHSGDHYFYNDRIALGNGASQDYIITTPDTTKWGHWLYKVVGGLGVDINIYEATDRNGTTLQTTLNSNRNSVNTAGLTVHKGQTGGTTDGTLIMANGFGTGTSGGSGGETSREEEIILKQNTKYLFRVTNRATVSNPVTIKLTWYEHTNRN